MAPEEKGNPSFIFFKALSETEIHMWVMGVFITVLEDM